jgi:hypothetical protein
MPDPPSVGLRPAQPLRTRSLPSWLCGLRRNQHLHLAQFFFMKVVLCLDVVVGLHVDPVPLRQPKGPGEPLVRCRA